MLRIATIVISFFCACILTSAIIVASKSKNPLRFLVRRILVMALIASLSNCLAVAVNYYYYSLVLYSIFSASISFLCFFLTDFTRHYNKNFQEVLAVKIWVFLTCVYDLVSMIINFIGEQHIIFDLKEVLVHGQVLYKIDSKPLYILHLLICYIPLTMVFFSFLHKSLTGPFIYRKKYYSIFNTIIICVALDAVYLAFDLPYDMSVIIFAVAGVSVCYYALFYTPQDLQRRMISTFIDSDSDGIICYDSDNELAFINNEGKRIYGILKLSENETKVFMKKEFEKWKKHNSLALEVNGEYSWMESRETNDGFLYYEKRFKQLFDDRKEYLGCYFTIHDSTKSQSDLKEQRFNATHDKLTGLYNREYFFEKTEELLNSQKNRDFVIIVSDIKDFKLVNDVFGSEAGDKILRQISDCIRIEAKESTVYGRYQGDRFCLCMPADRFSANGFVGLINHSMSVRGNDIYHMEIYLGIYKIQERQISVSSMCDRAFLALDSIKGDYNKTFAIYNEDLMVQARKDHEKAALLSESIKNDQFMIFLQPQLDVNGNCLGGEALVRWNDPERGLVMPGEFIGIFERTGAISVLDRYVWELACKQLQNWKRRGLTQYHISVNISPKDFYFTDIYNTFTNLVNQYEIDPKNLKLEITESAIMIDIESQKRLIHRLQDFGFVVEMDDFGSGYSSLNMLKDINVDVLKVDMAFLGKTENKERSEAILKAVMMMAKSLDMQVITEGVEEEDQIEFLKSIGCDIFQGHYFSPPIPVYKFEQKYFK